MFLRSYTGFGYPLNVQPINFTLSQLEYFLAAFERGSFTSAAEALGVSQPAVAEQIQRLERAVGQELFIRQARGVQPTLAAIEFESHARRVIDSSKLAAAAISSSSDPDQARVAFGTFGWPHQYGIEELIARFFEDHPGANLRIEARNSSATAQAVRSGDLDAAVVALPINEVGLTVTPIATSEVFYVSAEPSHTTKPATIDDVAERAFILYEASSGNADPTRTQLSTRAQTAGLRIDPRIEVDAAETALALAARGLGDTYAPSVLVSSLDSRLSAVPFDPPLHDTFALITRSGARLSPPVSDFIDRITSHLIQRIGGR